MERRYEKSLKEMGFMFNEAVRGKNVDLFFTTIHPVVQDAAKDFCSNPNDIEDTCQNVYLKLLEKIADGKMYKQDATGAAFRNSLYRMIKSSVPKNKLIEVGLNEASSMSVDLEVEDKIFNESMNNDLCKLLKRLRKKEEDVIRFRFGIDDGIEKSLDETSREFCVTREHIRQLEAKGLRRLRHPWDSRQLKHYVEFLK